MNENMIQDALSGDGMMRPAGGGLGASVGEILGLVFLLLGIAIAVGFVVFLIVAWWKMYTKAGRPGWSNLIPVYGWVEFFNIAWGNGVYFLFTLIPGVNVLVAILSVQKLSEAFGHGLGFTLGLFFFPYIFIPILGFGKSKHVRYQAKLAEKAKQESELSSKE